MLLNKDFIQKNHALFSWFSPDGHKMMAQASLRCPKTLLPTSPAPPLIACQLKKLANETCNILHHYIDQQTQPPTPWCTLLASWSLPSAVAPGRQCVRGTLVRPKNIAKSMLLNKDFIQKKHALFSWFSPEGPMDADHPDRCKTCQGTCGTWCMCNTPGLWNLSLGHPQNLETMNFIWASHTLTCWWPEKCWRKLR